MSENDAKDGACMQPGRMGWNELMTTDTDAAGNFYGSLFGWDPQPFPGNAGIPYTIFKQDGAEMGVGGMLKNPMPGAPAQWVPYVMSANTDASVKKACDLGAEVLLEPKDIPGVGRIAVIRDPQGAIFGVHQMEG